MRIGELAKRSGLNASRIRFYEACGLLTLGTRKANGYRDYPEEALWILEMIASGQRAGFSLEEIRQLLPQKAGEWKHDELLAGLKNKVAEIDAVQARLSQSRAQLLAVIHTIEDKPDDLGCADNARRVLQRLREDGLLPVAQG